jgi:hypothetical protein
MNSGWRLKRSFIGQINDFWTSVTNVFPQNRTFWRQKKLRAVARVTNLVLINKAWQAHKMSFQSQPSISSFFRQLTPQEREARSVAADQKARAEGSAKRPLVAPIPAAPALAKRRGRPPGSGKQKVSLVQPHQFQQHARQPSAAGATTSAAVPIDVALDGSDSADDEPVDAAPSKPTATSNPKAAAPAKKKAVHKDWFKSASDIEEILHFVRLNGGNVTTAVSKLRSLPHGRFQALAVSTVHGWLVPHQKKVQLLL